MSGALNGRERLGRIESVFLNIPYDRQFEDLYLAYIVGLTQLGLRVNAALAVPRNKFGGALLPDGRVLIAGGQAGGELSAAIRCEKEGCSMRCPVLVHLIRKLDAVRVEQSTSRGDNDVHGKRQQLRAIEALLDRHEQACPVCRQVNPGGTKFVELSGRR